MNGFLCPAIMDLSSRNVCEDCERLKECREVKNGYNQEQDKNRFRRILGR